LYIGIIAQQFLQDVGWRAPEPFRQRLHTADIALSLTDDVDKHLPVQASARGMVADGLRVKLIKIGWKMVSHGRHVIFQMVEVAVSRRGSG
jgi:hypothetical protein